MNTAPSSSADLLFRNLYALLWYPWSASSPGIFGVKSGRMETYVVVGILPPLPKDRCSRHAWHKRNKLHSHLLTNSEASLPGRCLGFIEALPHSVGLCLPAMGTRPGVFLC